MIKRKEKKKIEIKKRTEKYEKKKKKTSEKKIGYIVRAEKQ